MAQHERSEHWQERTRLFSSEINIVPEGKIVFFGDSITEGFDLKIHFPTSLPINRGISGDHIDGLLERLEHSVIRLKPSKLFILIGINDIGAGDPDSFILENYSLLLEKLATALPKSQIYIHSILPTTKLWINCPQEKIVRLNMDIYNNCLKFNFTWIELYSEFVNEDGFLNGKYTDDGLHLNGAGYDLWAKILRKFDLS